MPQGERPGQTACTPRASSSLFITGSTGEILPPCSRERKEIYSRKEASARHGVQVIAHTGSNSVWDARGNWPLSPRNADLVATSSLAPSYYKPATVQRLVECCAFAASGAPDLPYYYYDIPVLTGVRFNPVDFIKLAEQIPNFAGIKFTNPDLALYQTTLNYDKNVDIPWGVDEWFTGALSVGAKGAVGSSFNFAGPPAQSLVRPLKRDVETAKDCQWKSVQMINILASKGYMGCAKALMGWLGVDLGPARLPQGNPTADQLKELRSELEAIGFFQWAMN